MRKVRLLTESGEYVITAIIPAFITPPKIVVWGSRFFIQSTDEDYKEAFAVAAVITIEDPNNEATYTNVNQETMEEKAVAEQVGNDNLLFGLPKNLDEAVETFLAFFSNAKDFIIILELSQHAFIRAAHQSSGTFMRNSWFLWWHEGHKVMAWPKSKPPLIEYFNNLGIYHADDMSSIILGAAWSFANKKEFDLQGAVQYYQNYWKANGFPDGIPKNKNQ